MPRYIYGDSYGGVQGANLGQQGLDLNAAQFLTNSHLRALEQNQQAYNQARSLDLAAENAAAQRAAQEAQVQAALDAQGFQQGPYFDYQRKAADQARADTERRYQFDVGHEANLQKYFGEQGDLAREKLNWEMLQTPTSEARAHENLYTRQLKLAEQNIPPSPEAWARFNKDEQFQITDTLDYADKRETDNFGMASSLANQLNRHDQMRNWLGTQAGVAFDEKSDTAKYTPPPAGSDPDVAGYVNQYNTLSSGLRAARNIKGAMDRVEQSGPNNLWGPVKIPRNQSFDFSQDTWTPKLKPPAVVAPGWWQRTFGGSGSTTPPPPPPGSASMAPPRVPGPAGFGAEQQYDWQFNPQTVPTVKRIRYSATGERIE